MFLKKEKWKVFIVFAVILLIITFLASYFLLPEEISVIEGRKYQLDFHNPMAATITTDSAIETSGAFQLGTPLTLQAHQTGNYNLRLDLMGIIPVKETLLKVVKEQYVYPSGQSAGVKILTDGVLVLSLGAIVDSQNIQHLPAKEAGLEPGDYIFKVNGENLRNNSHLSQIVRECGGTPLEMEYKRHEKNIKTVITPAVSGEDGKLALGMWVRDSTAGLGTVTFYTQDKQKFAALGHCISDVDTGETMTVKDGELVKSKIIGQTKGKRGEPGELKGIFDEPQQEVGRIKLNNEFGLYGNVTDPSAMQGSTPVPLALRNEIKPGPAKLLATIDGYEVKEYDIEIIKIFNQQTQSIKNMVIQVTDPELLSKTGGIVQGMSGSPILQNGKLVGAVTHVFVNDPQKGYAVFVEWMLNQMEQY